MSVPGNVKAELRRLFGPGAEIISSSEMRRKSASENPESIPVKPMSIEQARWLCTAGEWSERIGARWTPCVGDIVKLREDSPFSSEFMIWPRMGELCVVTATPDDEKWGNKGDDGGLPLSRNDMILGWIHKCGDDDCHIENALVEYWHDSRFYERVGSVWDKDAKLERPVPGMK